MQLEISTQESELLTEVLSNCVQNLRSEIHRTVNPAYKA